MVNGKTFIFVIMYPENPQWDRCLFMFYSGSTGEFSSWKLCNMKYLEGGGADIDSLNPTRKGQVKQIAQWCHFYLESDPNMASPIAKMDFKRKPNLTNLNDNELFLFEESGKPFNARFIAPPRSGETFYAMSNAMVRPTA